MIFKAIRVNLLRILFENILQTMPGCVLCLRMIGLAFDCHDGTKEKLRPEQIERALKKVPSLLEITAFSLNFNGVLIGPQFPFVTHDLLVRIDVLLFQLEAILII